MLDKATIRRLFTRRSDKIQSSAGVQCSEDADHFELEVRYRGDPQAGGVGDAIRDGADLTTCPVCEAETEPLPAR